MAIFDYSNKTAESIANAMLALVDPEFDTREGSVIFNAIMPVAKELEQLYIQLDRLQYELDPNTASIYGLTLLGSQFGIEQRPAKAAELLGSFEFEDGAETDLTGLIFTSTENQQRYIATQKTEDPGFIYKLQAEEPGSAGNTTGGSLLPVTSIPGLQAAVITGVETYGRDEESTEEFRERYLSALVNKPFGGNIDYYREAVGAINGVGGVQVHPVWNGTGSVYLCVTDESGRAITDQGLLQTIQMAVDPTLINSAYASGSALAPIGHKVTVGTPTEIACNISLHITGAYTQQSVEKAIDDYFSELRNKWDNPDDFGHYSCSVYSSQIVSRILNLGVQDCTCTINGQAKLDLNETASSSTKPQLPVKGAVTYG